MDASFRVRVDKAFGSLTSTDPSSLSSLWCLTDDEMEKREWERDSPYQLPDFESKPFPPNLDGFFANKPHQTLAPSDTNKQLQSDLEELSDDCQEADHDDESDIRSCIGLDCTLDYEEEDEFDKVAVGREKEKQPGDRLYMRDVTDYGISIDTCHELPLTLQDVKRDTRANHLAAKLRLKEDAEAAAEEHQADAQYAKRVKLSQDNHHRLEQVEYADAQSVDSCVPDYIRNPSRYTCYSLDPCEDMDEESNWKACMDFLNLLKKQSQQHNDDASATSQKSPIFNPRTKQHPTGPLNKQGVEVEQMPVKKAVSLGISTMELDNAEVSAMEEDESYIATDRARPGSLQKPGRRYRTRAIIDSDNQ